MSPMNNPIMTLLNIARSGGNPMAAPDAAGYADDAGQVPSRITADGTKSCQRAWNRFKRFFAADGYN